MEAVLQTKPDQELAAPEWIVRMFGYRQRMTPEEHGELRTALEGAVKRSPDHADIWACLAQIYVDEDSFGFNLGPGALERALAAARRAVEIDRTNQLGYQLLAQTHFFRRDLAAFRPVAEQAMALNPRDSNTIAILGLMLVHAREFERGGKIVRKAMALNPHHAGWYHFGPLWEHFQAGEYEEALSHANRINMPGLFWQYLAVASICGHLGRAAEAEAAVRELLEVDPEFTAHARRNIESWHFASGLVEPLLDGLHKAGLEFRDETSEIAGGAGSET
jgi:tetratricopeptide (TPR) repeat protein